MHFIGKLNFQTVDNDLLVTGANRTRRLLPEPSAQLQCCDRALLAAENLDVHQDRSGGPSPPVAVRHDAAGGETGVLQHNPELAAAPGHVL